MSRAVTGFSFLGILNNIGTLIIGLISIAIGIIIRSYDDVPLTVVDAKVSSATWKGNDGCESEMLRRTTYNLGGAKNKEEYKFSNIGQRYTKNQRSWCTFYFSRIILVMDLYTTRMG